MSQGPRVPAPHVLAALRAVQPRLGAPAGPAGRAPHVQAALQRVTQARSGPAAPGGPAFPTMYIKVRTPTGHIPLSTWTSSTPLFVPSET